MAHEFKSPIGILSFPHLFTPRPRAQGRPAEFSMSLIFREDDQKHANYQAMKKAIYDAGVEEFGADKMKDPKFLATLSLPVKDAAEKDYEGYDEGRTYISLWCKEAPQVIDRDRIRITEASRVWAGQRAMVSGRAFAWNQSGKRGVSLFLEHVWIVNEKLPRIDGRKSAADRFASEDVSNEAMTDEEIPF